MNRVLLAFALLLATVSVASAKKPEDVFGGKIILSDKPFPTEAKSASGYISAVKKASKDRFNENADKKGWKIYYAAFFKKPINDLEVTLKFYDVTDGGNRVVESYEQFMSQRGQRVIIANIKLKKWDGQYDPNSKILMTIESKGKVVAQGTFWLIGEGKKFKGKVSFDEEEAAEGAKEEE